MAKLAFRFLLLQKKVLFKKTNLREVRINLTLTQHLSCKARINGFKANLLIDTGASNSCIALAQKNYFSIMEKGNPFEAAGAGEDKMKAILAHNCNLFLGRHFMGEQSFVLLDMQYINATLVKEGGKTIEGTLLNAILTQQSGMPASARKKMMF